MYIISPITIVTLFLLNQIINRNELIHNFVLLIVCFTPPKLSDMKRSLLFFSLIIMFSFSSKAQKPITAYDDSVKFGNMMLPGIVVNIPEANFENTLKTWIKELETGTKSKVVTETSDMTIFGAILKDITPNPINVYSRMVSQDSMLLLTASFELKKDLYIERGLFETEYARARSFMFNFAKNRYIEVVNDQLKAEENKLRDLQKELGSLDKDETGMNRAIRSNNKLISAEKDRLIVLNNELTSVSAALIEHNTQLNSMAPGNERDEKEKYIKSLEQQKKKILKSIKKSENRIVKSEKTIDNANRSIPKVGNNQDRTRYRITDQENVVQSYYDKLNKIKAYQ